MRLCCNFIDGSVLETQKVKSGTTLKMNLIIMVPGKSNGGSYLIKQSQRATTEPAGTKMVMGTIWRFKYWRHGYARQLV